MKINPELTELQNLVELIKSSTLGTNPKVLKVINSDDFGIGWDKHGLSSLYSLPNTCRLVSTGTEVGYYNTTIFIHKNKDRVLEDTKYDNASEPPYEVSLMEHEDTWEFNYRRLNPSVQWELVKDSKVTLDSIPDKDSKDNLEIVEEYFRTNFPLPSDTQITTIENYQSNGEFYVYFDSYLGSLVFTDETITIKYGNTDDPDEDTDEPEVVDDPYHINYPYINRSERSPNYTLETNTFYCNFTPSKCPGFYLVITSLELEDGRVLHDGDNLLYGNNSRVPGFLWLIVKRINIRLYHIETSLGEVDVSIDPWDPSSPITLSNSGISVDIGGLLKSIYGSLSNYNSKLSTKLVSGERVFNFTTLRITNSIYDSYSVILNSDYVSSDTSYTTSFKRKSIYLHQLTKIHKNGKTYGTPTEVNGSTESMEQLTNCSIVLEYDNFEDIVTRFIDNPNKYRIISPILNQEIYLEYVLVYHHLNTANDKWLGFYSAIPKYRSGDFRFTSKDYKVNSVSYPSQSSPEDYKTTELYKFNLMEYLGNSNFYSIKTTVDHPLSRYKIDNTESETRYISTDKYQLSIDDANEISDEVIYTNSINHLMYDYDPYLKRVVHRDDYGDDHEVGKFLVLKMISRLDILSTPEVVDNIEYYYKITYSYHYTDYYLLDEYNLSLPNPLPDDFFDLEPVTFNLPELTNPNQEDTP